MTSYFPERGGGFCQYPDHSLLYAVWNESWNKMCGCTLPHFAQGNLSSLLNWKVRWRTFDLFSSCLLERFGINEK